MRRWQRLGRVFSRICQAGHSDMSMGLSPCERRLFLQREVKDLPESHNHFKLGIEMRIRL